MPLVVLLTTDDDAAPPLLIGAAASIFTTLPMIVDVPLKFSVLPVLLPMLELALPPLK